MSVFSEYEFSVLIKENMSTFRRIAGHELGVDHGDIDDVIQKALIWTWENWDDTISNVLRWLSGVVRRIARCYRVESFRKWRETQFLTDQTGALSDPTTVHTAQYQPSVEDGREHALEGAIGRLQPKERQIIHGLYYEGKQKQEVARDLNITPDMVGYYLHGRQRKARRKEKVGIYTKLHREVLAA